MTLSLNLNFKGTFCVKIVKQGPRGFICKSDIFHESYCLQSHEYKTYAWPGDGRWRQVIRRWVHHALCSHNFHFHNQTLSMISNVCSQTVGLQNFFPNGTWTNLFHRIFNFCIRCASIAKAGVTGVCNWGVMVSLNSQPTLLIHICLVSFTENTTITTIYHPFYHFLGLGLGCPKKSKFWYATNPTG